MGELQASAPTTNIEIFYNKKKRDFNLKFSLYLCLETISVIFQWSVLLNIKRGTKTYAVEVNTIIAAHAMGGRKFKNPRAAKATAYNTM